jgi:hypothetical protein
MIQAANPKHHHPTSWQKLLCKKDKELFGASPASLDAIDKQDVYCPTNDEVKARMAELGNPS